MIYVLIGCGFAIGALAACAVCFGGALASMAADDDNPPYCEERYR